MDVTTSNFHQVRKFITEKLLPNLLYLSYDVQFTGLKFENFQRDYINSIPFEKYKKLKYVAENYQIIQLGLSLVVEDRLENKIKVYPYNFYLFPRNPIGYDKNLGMQLQCIKFNSQNGMDWNKWIREGINYVKLSQMQLIQQDELRSSVQEILRNNSQEFREYAQSFIRKCIKLAKQIQILQFQYDIHQNYLYQKSIPNIFNSLIKQEDLDLALKVTQKKYIITKISNSQKTINLNRLYQDKYGFGLLFKSIWKKKVPFIGHNCNLDLLYIYHHLVAPLPQDYFQFKCQLRKSENTFYDTKYIAIKYPIISQNGSRLEDLVKTLKKEKNESKLYLDKPYDRYNLQNFCLHEAGYDSFLTAWVYQQAMKKIDSLQKDCNNKININKSFFFINITKNEDEVNMKYARNVIRFNINVGDKQDVKVKRQEFVRLLKDNLQKFQGMYYLHEGYRQIFLDINEEKIFIIKKIFKLIQLKKIRQQEVCNFASYFDWQAERIYREYKKNQEKQSNQQKYKNFNKIKQVNNEKSESKESNSSKGQELKKKKIFS